MFTASAFVEFNTIVTIGCVFFLLLYLREEE
jgi:hypothetical protein